MVNTPNRSKISKQPVKLLWETPNHSHYTNHGIPHSETILKKLYALLEGQSPDLSEVETFILLASCSLHDVGMQCCEKDLLKKVAGIEKEGASFSDNELEKVRSVHFELTHAMIVNSAVELDKKNRNLPSLGLEGVESLFIHAIAKVSKAHSDSDYKTYCEEKDMFIPEGGARMLLLAALLRLGDALDADQSRCNRERYWHMHKSLDPFSQANHWKHYFVKNVDVKKNGYIRLYFSIPDKYESCKQGIQEMAEKNIRLHKEDFKEVWRTYSIKIDIDKPVFDPKSPDLLRAMPEKVVEYFENLGKGLQEPTIQEPDKNNASKPLKVQSNVDIFEKVQKEITFLFERSEMAPFVEEMKIDEPKEPSSSSSSKDLIRLVKKLMRRTPITEALIYLDSLTIQCFQKMKEQGGTQGAQAAIWKNLEKLIGWLLLLAVKEEWVQANKEKFKKVFSDEGDLFEISGISLLGTEITVSRMSGKAVELDRIPGRGVVGKGLFDSTKLREIPTGWSKQDKLGEIKKVLWDAIYNGTISPPAYFDVHNDKQLDTAISLRWTKSEKHYLVLEVPGDLNPVQNAEIRQKLVNDLPSLFIMSVDTRGDSDVLIIGDGELNACVNELFRNKF